MSARGNGGTYHYYACTGRQKYGPKACRGERLPQEKLEQAVLRQLAVIYRDGILIRDAVVKAEARAQRHQLALERRLSSIGSEIVRAERALERYYEAFEQGTLSAERCDERLSRLQARLDDLRGEQAELAAATPDEGTHAPTAVELAAIADQLDQLMTNAEPQQAKALLATSSLSSKWKVARRSSPATASSHLRFAQHPKKWAIQDSNLGPLPY